MTRYELQYEMAGTLQRRFFDTLEDALAFTKGLAGAWELRKVEVN